MYLNTFNDNSGKFMGVVVVSIMQVFHLLFIYIIFSNLFHLSRSILKDYRLVTYIIIALILILNNYRYYYIKPYENMHNNWLNAVNSDNSNKGWLLVLYIILNLSLTIAFGVLSS
jgi:hypothetical protein